MEDIFERNILGLDISKFRIVWVAQIPFLVPENLSIKQEKYLIASQLTVLLNNKSVDNIIKNHMLGFEEGKETNLIDERIILLEEGLKYSNSNSSIIITRLENIVFNPETQSSLAVEALFLRLQATEKSIHFHLKFGYYYECIALIRLVLEQLAFAFTSSNVSNGVFSKFLSPTESIKHLKKLIPNAGRLYGTLSNLAHIDKSTIHKYVKVQNAKTYAVQNSIYFSLEALMYYLKVLEYKNIVFEYAFRNYLDKFNYIEINPANNSVSVKAHYENQNYTKEFISKIQAIIENVEM